MRARSALVEFQDASNTRVQTFRQIYELFLSKAEKIFSDGTVTEEGPVRASKTQGATLTSGRVIQTAKQVAEKKAAAAQKRISTAIVCEKRQFKKSIEQGQRVEKPDEREKLLCRKFLLSEIQRAMSLLEVEQILGNSPSSTQNRLLKFINVCNNLHYLIQFLSPRSTITC